MVETFFRPVYFVGHLLNLNRFSKVRDDGKVVVLTTSRLPEFEAQLVSSHSIHRSKFHLGSETAIIPMKERAAQGMGHR